jgi:hypothetical protein
MIVWIVYVESENTWQEESVTWLKLVSRHSSGGTEENYVNHSQEIGLRAEMRVKSVHRYRPQSVSNVKTPQ